MSIELNDENIQKLIDCRNIVNKYSEKINNNPEKSSYMEDMLFELAKRGGFLIYQQFQFFNEAMNLLEYDNCFRIRPVRDIHSTTPHPEDFCYNGDGCTKRNIVPCVFNDQNVACYNREWGILYVLPHDKSQMVAEYKQYAEAVNGVTEDLLIPHPLFCIGCHFVSPSTDMPPRCLGSVLKIKEPRFDVYWGMDRIKKFVLFANNVREDLMNG